MTDNNRIRIRVIEMEGAKDDLTSVLAFITGAPNVAEPMALPEAVDAEPERAPEPAAQTDEPEAEPPEPRPKVARSRCEGCGGHWSSLIHGEHKRQMAAQSAEPAAFS